MNKNAEKLVKKYNQGLLTDFSELESMIKRGEIEIKDLENLSFLSTKIEGIKIPEPSVHLDENFNTLLADEKSKRRSWDFFSGLNTLIESWGWSTNSIRLAYSSFLLMVGIGIGLMLSDQNDQKLTTLADEVKTMKELMLVNMLEESSVTERLKAVNLTNNITNADVKVINALITTLNNDDNVNVRFAALESLYNFSQNPIARAGLVEAIKFQESPMIQIALAEIMVAFQEKSSIQDLRKLLENNDLDQGVKNKINESIERII